MNADLSRLQPYPFQKLATLFAGSLPPKELAPISLTIGEPKHPTPGFIAESLLAHLHNLSVYPNTKGLAGLRESIAQWLVRRFGLPAGAIDPEHQVLPVNGTREALFSFAQAVVDRRRERPLVMMPNPFYQIYEGAALLAGAEPRFIPCRAEAGFLPDFDAVSDAEWQRCQLLYLCSPGNPTGAVIGLDRLKWLMELADHHGFVLAADECYSEIYFDEERPPVGLLQAAVEMGNDRFKNCVVFHSLSKRSNAPGLRSGFVAGDAEILRGYFDYRTYHGCAMPLQHQIASRAAWDDEAHVRANRALYREKFDAVLERLGTELNIQRPEAGFYLWAETPIPDTDFALELYRSQHVSVLPGSYLSREADGVNPGARRVRMALVAPLDECVEAADRINAFMQQL